MNQDERGIPTGVSLTTGEPVYLSIFDFPMMRRADIAVFPRLPPLDTYQRVTIDYYRGPKRIYSGVPKRSYSGKSSISLALIRRFLSKQTSLEPPAPMPRARKPMTLHAHLADDAIKGRLSQDAEWPPDQDVDAERSALVEHLNSLRHPDALWTVS